MKVNLDLAKTNSSNLITDELKTDLGSLAFELDHDRFFGSTDMRIWTGVGETGTQLTDGVDYSVQGLDADLTAESVAQIYSEVIILNVTYQTGDLYFNYHAAADEVDEDDRYLAYGEIWVVDNSTPVEISSAAHTQITAFDTDGESRNTTPENANDHIIVLIPGRYLVTVSAVVENAAGAGHTVHVEMKTNNGTVDYDNVHAHRTLGAGTDKGSLSLSGICNFSKNETVELWMTTTRGAGSDVIISDCNLSITQVGPE